MWKKLFKGTLNVEITWSHFDPITWTIQGLKAFVRFKTVWMHFIYFLLDDFSGWQGLMGNSLQLRKKSCIYSTYIYVSYLSAQSHSWLWFVNIACSKFHLLADLYCDFSMKIVAETFSVSPSELSSNPSLASILIPAHARSQAAASTPTNASSTTG